MGTGETRLSPSSETPGRANPERGLGAANPISGDAKWRSGERESERPIVLVSPWEQKHGGGKGPYSVCVRDGAKRW